MNFSGKDSHPNIQPSARPGIERGTSGLGGRDFTTAPTPPPYNNAQRRFTMISLPRAERKLHNPFPRRGGDKGVLTYIMGGAVPPLPSNPDPFRPKIQFSIRHIQTKLQKSISYFRPDEICITIFRPGKTWL